MQNLCAVCNRLVTYDDIDITPEELVTIRYYYYY